MTTLLWRAQWTNQVDQKRGDMRTRCRAASHQVLQRELCRLAVARCARFISLGATQQLTESPYTDSGSVGRTYILGNLLPVSTTAICVITPYYFGHLPMKAGEKESAQPRCLSCNIKVSAVQIDLAPNNGFIGTHGL